MYHFSPWILTGLFEILVKRRGEKKKKIMWKDASYANFSKTKNKKLNANFSVFIIILVFKDENQMTFKEILKIKYINFKSFFIQYVR